MSVLSLNRHALRNCNSKGSSPSPSSVAASHDRRARQISNPTTFIKAQLSFRNRNLVPTPIRKLVVVATGGYYRGSVRVRDAYDIGRTDPDGNVSFDFSPAAGETVRIDGIYTILASPYYRVGTLGSNYQLETKMVNLKVDPEIWAVAKGQTIFTTALYEYSIYNLGLLVADAYTTITEWFVANVATEPSEQKLIEIVFPAEADKAYFQPYTDGSAQIFLGQVHAHNPSVMAHEYGHFAHFLARGTAEYGPGGTHWFCRDAVDKNLQLSFSEGYATAFGQSAIDDTLLMDPWSPYGQYSNRQYAPAKSWGVNIEAYNCTDHYLTRQEGRIAATLFDLVGRQLDVFSARSDDVGRISEGFDPARLAWMWPKRWIFWDMVKLNPQSIEDYW